MTDNDPLHGSLGPCAKNKQKKLSPWPKSWKFERKVDTNLGLKLIGFRTNGPRWLYVPYIHAYIRKWFEPRSNIPWLKKIIWVIGVLRRTVVIDWRFDNLCGSHLQSLKMADGRVSSLADVCKWMKSCNSVLQFSETDVELRGLNL